MATPTDLTDLRRECLRAHWRWWTLERHTNGGETRDETLIYALWSRRQAAKEALYDVIEAKRRAA
jgi:hypothetical protein